MNTKEIIVCDHHSQAHEYIKRVGLERVDCTIVTNVDQLKAMEYESCAIITTNSHFRNVALSRKGRKAKPQLVELV